MKRIALLILLCVSAMASETPVIIDHDTACREIGVSTNEFIQVVIMPIDVGATNAHAIFRPLFKPGITNSLYPGIWRVTIEADHASPPKAKLIRVEVPNSQTNISLLDAKIRR